MKRVEIYTTPTCHFCHMAKEFFKANGIEYVEYDVATDVQKRQEMVKVTGQLGVPVTLIGGKDVIICFDEKALRKLLDI